MRSPSFFAAFAVFLLLWVFAAFLLTQGIFAAGGSLRGAGWLWGAAWLLAFGGTAALFPGDGKKQIAGVGLASVLLWLLFSGIAFAVHDFSYDGQCYHQEAIIRLAQGWNPWTHPLTAADTNQYEWLNGYPKITWQTGVLSYLLWNRLETAKAAMWLVGASVAVLATLWSAQLARQTPAPRFVHAVTLLLLFCPVAVLQWVTFQLDGYVYWCMVGLLLGAAGIAYPRLSPVREPVSYTFFCVSALMLAAAKFTGIVYAVYVAVVVAALLWVRRRDLVTLSAKRAAPVVLCLAAVTALSLFHPYWHNTVRYGHPLWPVMGRGATDIIGYAEHPDFVKQNGVVKFVWANNARARNIAGFRTAADNARYGKPVWKLPFALYRSEAAAYIAPDVHVGGFGPWYGGALLTATLLLGVCVVQKTPGSRIALGVWTIVWGSVLINPESWWVRYSPQGWWLVLIPLAACVFAPRPVRTAGMMLSALLFVNVAIVGGVNTAAQFLCERSYARQNALLRAAAPGSWAVRYGNARSNRRRFIEEGITATPAPDAATETAPGWYSAKLARTDTVLWTTDKALADSITAASPRGAN